METACGLKMMGCRRLVSPPVTTQGQGHDHQRPTKGGNRLRPDFQYFLLTVSAEKSVGEAELSGAGVDVASAVAGEELLVAGGLRPSCPVVLELAPSEQAARSLECVGDRPKDVPDSIEELSVGVGEEGCQAGEDEAVETHGSGVRGQQRLLWLGSVCAPAGGRVCARV